MGILLCDSNLDTDQKFPENVMTAIGLTNYQDHEAAGQTLGVSAHPMLLRNVNVLLT